MGAAKGNRQAHTLENGVTNATIHYSKSTHDAGRPAHAMDSAKVSAKGSAETTACRNGPVIARPEQVAAIKLHTQSRNRHQPGE